MTIAACTTPRSGGIPASIDANVARSAAASATLQAGATTETPAADGPLLQAHLPPGERRGFTAERDLPSLERERRRPCRHVRRHVLGIGLCRVDPDLAAVN